MTLDEKFWKLTGLTYPLSALLESVADKSAEEKEKMAQAIAWNMKGGYVINEGENNELYTEIIGEVASSLGVDRKDISRLAEDQEDSTDSTDSSDDSENETQTYTAAEAAQYNAGLTGAVHEGDVKEEAVEAQNAEYSFVSYDSQEKTTQYGTGTVEVTELREDGATVKVLTNTANDPNAANFVGQSFNVNSLDETAVLQLFSTQGLAQDIWVTVSKTKDAVEGKEAVLWTKEDADAYNATLDGAIKEGDAKPSQVEIIGD